MGLFNRRKDSIPVRRSNREAKDPKDAPGDRRVIKTGRTVEEINAVARKGFRPLVKPVQQNTMIHSTIAVFQNPLTGIIEISRSRRSNLNGSVTDVKVLDYRSYYPYHFPEPFAAYLLPHDLVTGEEVWLEDLIEDLVAVWGNYGNPRLEGAPAIWNGTDFEILFDPDRDAMHWIG